MKTAKALLLAAGIGLSASATAATVQWTAGDATIWANLAVATDGTYTVGGITQIKIGNTLAFEQGINGYLQFTIQGNQSTISKVSPGGNQQLDVVTPTFQNGFTVYQTSTNNFGSLQTDLPFGATGTDMASAFVHMKKNLVGANPWLTGTVTSTDISFRSYLASPTAAPAGCVAGALINSFIGDGSVCDVTQYENESETVDIALTGGDAISKFTSDWDGVLSITNNKNTQTTAYAYRGATTVLTTVPEPATIALLGLGFIGMGFAARRQSDLA